jgi:hypothetical protein
LTFSAVAKWAGLAADLRQIRLSRLVENATPGAGLDSLRDSRHPTTEREIMLRRLIILLAVVASGLIAATSSSAAPTNGQNSETLVFECADATVRVIIKPDGGASGWDVDAQRELTGIRYFSTALDGRFYLGALTTEPWRSNDGTDRRRPSLHDHQGVGQPQRPRGNGVVLRHRNVRHPRTVRP